METLYNIKIQHIFFDVSEEVSEDEIFLKFRGKKIWPTDKRYGQIKRGEHVAINIIVPEINEGETAVIELWDWDLFSSNDHLGDFPLKADQKGGPYRTDMKPTNENDTAKYALQWSIVFAD